MLKRNIQCVSLLLVSMFVTLQIFGQQKTISGFVSDSQSKEPLIGASILIKDTYIGTLSNQHGFFSLVIPSAKQSGSLVISYTGYESYVGLIDSTVNKNTFYLKGGINIEEVTVSYRKTIEERTEMSMFRLPLSDIEFMPQLFQADLVKTIQFLPGIQGGREGSAGLYVRGGETEQNLVLLDDVPIYYANHAGNMVSTFDNNTIKEFALYKGAFPARFGGRMSSVLDIRMKEGDKNRFRGEVGLGIISGNVFLEGPIVKDKASFFVSYRNFWPAALLKTVTDGKTNYSFSDFSAKVSANISDIDKLIVSLYKGGDTFINSRLKENEGDSYSKATTEWKNALAAVKYTRQLSSRHFADFTGYYTRYDYFNENKAFHKESIEDSLYSEQYVTYTSMIKDYSLKATFDFIPANNLSFKYGGHFVWHNYLPGASAFSNSIEESSIRDTSSYEKSFVAEPSLFVEMDYNVTGNLSFNAGLRHSYIIGSDFLYPAWEPRLLINYNLVGLFAIKASYGHMTQNVNRLNYSSTGFQNDIWLPPTNIVKPGKSKQGAIGIFKTLGNGMYEISVEGYYKTLENLIAFKPGESFFAGNSNWDQKIETNGTGEAKGIELFVQKNAGKLNGWISYTLAGATRHFENKNNGNVFPFNYDRRHDFSIVANYPINSKWTVSGTFVFGSGYPITIANTTYKVQTIKFASQRFNDLMNAYIPINNYKGINAYRMENYHRADIAFTCKKKKKKTERIWNFSVYNLYNRKNPLYYDYFNTNKGVELYKYTMFPIMPSISYTVKF